MRNKSTLKYYTLIELLISIAIIVILAGLLLPSLRQARAKGNQIACMSNLKQWSYAFNSYIQDNNEFFPFGRNNSFSPWRQWYDYLSPYVGQEDPSKPGYMRNRLKNNTLKNCPAKYWVEDMDKNYGGSAPDGDQRPDYLANSALCPYYDGTAIQAASLLAWKIQAVRKISKTLLLVDGGGMGGMIARLEFIDPADIYCILAYFRHNKGVDTLFLDGHVTWMKMPNPGGYLDIASKGSLNGQLWE